MSDFRRPPTKAEKSAAWLACASAMAGLAWTTYEAYARAYRGPDGSESAHFASCMWLLLVAIAGGLTCLVALAFAMERASTWLHWALTTEAEKPADAPFDDEADWR